ncbi:MAG TPA: hypothetical protein VMP11_10880 [Verrucomicrobiae bacterium]|nr:hypothetical protein [Verrucomicrobiae bacterium]
MKLRDHTSDEKATRAPGFDTWRSVYLFVFGSFILWVVLLVVLSTIFS